MILLREIFKIERKYLIISSYIVALAQRQKLVKIFGVYFENLQPILQKKR